MVDSGFTNLRNAARIGPRHGLELDEVACVAAIRAGDESACTDLVRHCADRMFHIARRVLRCEHDAADAVQDAFLSAFRSLDQFTHRFRISAWLHRIVVNACLMKLRSDRNKPLSGLDGFAGSHANAGAGSDSSAAWHTPAPCQMQMRELRATVRRCIDELPGPYRLVLVLRHIEEFDTQETADRLGISATAVRVRLQRARQMLRTRLDRVLQRECSERAE